MSEAIVKNALQAALVDLIDLSLQGKQAHWNIQGPRFRSLHLQLDEIVEEVRAGSDDVAERLAALGHSPDGRAATVSKESGIGDIAENFLPVSKGYELMVSKLQAAADRIKENLDEVDAADPLTADMLIGIATGLEKQAWMLRSATVEE